MGQMNSSASESIALRNFLDVSAVSFELAALRRLGGMLCFVLV